MKRDWNLLRCVLREAESCESGHPLVLTQGIYGGDHYALDIGERDFLEVCRHIELLGDGGLAVVRILGGNSLSLAGVVIDRLTMLGHSFLEAAQDEDRWQKAVISADEKGGLLQELISRLQHSSKVTTQEVNKSSRENYVDPNIIEELRSVESCEFDLSKVVRFCEELNSSFVAENYIATTLLIRALINHIPPIFGQKTFPQVVSQVSKSRRELFSPLENVARDVADLHNHDLVRHKENLPTRNQVEPFKPNLEVLLQELIVEIQKSK
ncbi:DUF2513 domain-containing protein [Phormidesmis sp. 146-35]